MKRKQRVTIRRGKWSEDVLEELPGVDDKTPAGVGRGHNRYRESATERAERLRKEREQRGGS